MVIGDGALNYGPEQIFEAYYRIQLGRYAQLSPDYQRIVNPALQPGQGTGRRIQYPASALLLTRQDR